MTTKKLGDLGEQIACEYLVKKRYKILDKNYRIKLGEIDIIAQKRWRLFTKRDKTVHFIEVKTIINRDNNFFPEQKVDYRKQSKLRQLAEIWLGKNKFKQPYPYQIDVIGIIINPLNQKAKIHYFENVVEDLPI